MSVAYKLATQGVLGSDVLALAFTWLAIALLDLTLRRPRAVRGFALGICCGLAGLTTLTGTFVLSLVGLNWLWARRRTAFANRTLYWIVAGAGLVLLPLARCAMGFSG